MRSVRACRTGTVAAVIAWKLAALALLPVALCCQAVMSAEGTATPACCEGGEHGAMCPMKRGARTGETAAARDVPDQPRMIGCNSLDDALIGLVSLTGFTPDVYELTSHLSVGDRIAAIRYASASLSGGPSPPPPRAPDSAA